MPKKIERIMLASPRKIIKPIAVSTNSPPKRSNIVTNSTEIPLIKKGTFLIMKPSTNKVKIKPQCERNDFIKTKKSLITASTQISMAFAKIYIYKKVFV